MNYPKSFTDLVECFKRLPGIGGKSAERLAYHVLSMDKEYVQEFANVLAHFQDNIHYCKKCGHINSLFERLDGVKEVIIATNPTREGETTALFLAKLLAKKGIETSRIANGLPIGSNIDYADELTLLKSLEGRKKI